MNRKQILTKILQAKISQEVIMLKVEPTPFESEYYEFVDYSVIQPNLSQIAIFNKDTMLIANFEEITDFRTRALTPNDLAKKVVSMSTKELEEKENDLDLSLETIKENRKNTQEEELKEFIKSKMPTDIKNKAVENILFTAWKNTYGNRKIDYNLNMNELGILKETIKIIIKEREELVL